MKTTVVITTYNGEKHILEQLDSIKNQTATIDEILIFDDCSSDNTVAISASYIEDNNLLEWKIIRNQKQLGWRKNFIKGFSAAKGDLIFPCDQDDIWHLDKIENMTTIMEQHPEIDVLASNYNVFFQDGAEEFTRNYKNDKTIESVSVSPLNLYNQRPGCAMAFRKSFFEKNLFLWNPDLAHDEFLWKTSLLLGSLAIYNECTIEYRRHEGNVTRRSHSISNRIMENRACKCYFERLYNEKLLSYGELVAQEFKFYSAREKFLEDRRPKSFLSLIQYRKLYKTRNNFLGDLMYLIHPSFFEK